MKKILIPFCLLLVAGIGLIVFAISVAYNNVQYEKDALAHVMAANNGGELTAEYMGQSTRVLEGNIGRIQRIVTVTERKRIFSKPEFDIDSAVKLRFSDGAEYIIAKDPSLSDVAFVIYSYNGKKLYFSVKGYKTMESTIRAISPEGYYNANELIKDTEKVSD